MGLMEEMKILKEMQDLNEGKKGIHSELWHACAGPLVSLPQVGGLVYYFPQGHSEQVAVSTKRSANSQIPNYPNLQSQLLCQVHNVTLHADKDTDEIFAQMSLQPIKSEKDVFHVSDFGLKPSRHPTEFFCKTLTASDTSTHGGFSVPRRAAEKLFPPLDYSMQPPTQELVVRDLHENTWTFRHIYRGQPKRHLLTTGWSVFVGSKRLRAGDSVLFIRDEKSQLMIGVRRANRQQTALPSSVLSADSMHIGVLAAAAHAAANRTPFSVFYNPRACPSEFVVSANRFRKAVYGTQISTGMRFGMMFETEESGKRRYMGTIVGVSDLDPIRWSGSKWRSLQVEWDEPGCGEKQNRVSPWEIETPESLFLFPSLTSGFKRAFPSGYFGRDFEWGNPTKRPLIQQGSDTTLGNFPSVYSEELIKMLLRPQTASYPPSTFLDATKSKTPAPTAHGNIAVEEPQVHNKEANIAVLQPIKKSEPVNQTTTTVVSQPELGNANGLLPFTDVPDWLPGLPELPDSLAMSEGQELWDPPNPTQSGVCDCLGFDGVTNSGSAMIDPSSVSDAAVVGFEPMKDAAFGYAPEFLLGNFGSSQDLQSQITSASFSIQDFPDNNSGGTSSSNVDFDDSSLLQNSAWQPVNPNPNPPPVRTYTKVQKAGSVGRSIDVTSFKNYDELRSAIECMFGLDGLLSDPRGSGWKLVYVDFENDVLLVGDDPWEYETLWIGIKSILRTSAKRTISMIDPWEEFVSCVRCIRILSPAEVHQMSEEGMQLPTVSTN